ncbi:MAG: hypothetical protein L0229_16840 [Blastocatellia bacterium]|nr:hypothetical protein [Blastocatellia bacterium]
MVAVRKSIEEKDKSEDECIQCRGTGIVSYWSEFSYFEDRRSCNMCEVGQQVDAKIADIIARVQTEEHALRR